MDVEPRQQKERKDTTSALNAAIEAMNLAKESSSITPAKAVFDHVSVVLTITRVSFLLVCLDRLQAETI